MREDDGELQPSLSSTRRGRWLLLALTALPFLLLALIVGIATTTLSRAHRQSICLQETTQQARELGASIQELRGPPTEQASALVAVDRLLTQLREASEPGGCLEAQEGLRTPGSAVMALSRLQRGSDPHSEEAVKDLIIDLERLQLLILTSCAPRTVHTQSMVYRLAGGVAAALALSLGLGALWLGSLRALHDLADQRQRLNAQIEAKEAERARQAELLRRMELASAQGDAGTWELDPVARSLSLSARAKAQLGWKPEEVSNDPSEWDARVHREDRQLLVDAIDAAVERGQALDVEFRMMHRDGQYRWLHSRAHIDRGPDGEGLRLLGSQMDVTERRQLTRIRDNFISVVSHELRTPLTSIIGSLGLVHAGIMGELPPQAQEMLGLARKNSERLLRLISDMLDVEKIESGLMRFDIHTTPLRPLVDQAIDALRGYASTVGVRFIVEDGIPEAQVEVDPDRMIQVIVNLLSNATKFSPPGGAVRITLSRRGSWLRVEVTDEGPGVPEAFQPQLFEKFTQADSETNRSQEGTGIGLTIARAIIQRLEGHIDYVHRPGEGATFYFELKEPWA